MSGDHIVAQIWQPIGTAPRNTPILVTDGKIAITLVHKTHDSDWEMIGVDGWDCNKDFDWQDLTHWMPIPALPPVKETE